MVEICLLFRDCGFWILELMEIWLNDFYIKEYILTL